MKLLKHCQCQKWNANEIEEIISENRSSFSIQFHFHKNYSSMKANRHFLNRWIKNNEHLDIPYIIYENLSTSLEKIDNVIEILDCLDQILLSVLEFDWRVHNRKYTRNLMSFKKFLFIYWLRIQYHIKNMFKIRLTYSTLDVRWQLSLKRTQ